MKRVEESSSLRSSFPTHYQLNLLELDFPVGMMASAMLSMTKFAASHIVELPTLLIFQGKN